MLLTSHLVRWLMIVLISIFLQTAKGHGDLKQHLDVLQFQCEDLACFQKYWQGLSAEWDAGVVEAFKSRGVSLMETTDSDLALIPIVFRQQARAEKDGQADFFQRAWNYLLQLIMDRIKVQAGEGNEEPAEDEEYEQAKFYKTTWKDLPQVIKDWIKANPYQTAFYITSGVVFFAPSAISGPVLWLLGFTPVGPRAASIAALLQSKIGLVGAKSFFAYLQSAGMGGYGAAAINTVVRVLTFLCAAVHIVWYNSTGSDKQKRKKSKISSEPKGKWWSSWANFGLFDLLKAISQWVISLLSFVGRMIYHMFTGGDQSLVHCG